MLPGLTFMQSDIASFLLASVCLDVVCAGMISVRDPVSVAFLYYVISPGMSKTRVILLYGGIVPESADSPH